MSSSILKSTPWQNAYRPTMLLNGEYIVKIHTDGDCMPVIKESSTGKTFVLSVTLEVVKGVTIADYDVCTGYRKRLHVPLWSTGVAAGGNRMPVSSDYIMDFSSGFIIAFSDINPTDVLSMPEPCGFRNAQGYTIPDPFPFHRTAKGQYANGVDNNPDKWQFERLEEK